MSITVFKQSLNLSRRIYSWLAIGLAVCALTVYGNAMTIKAGSPAQNPKGVVDQNKDEDETVQPNDDNQPAVDLANENGVKDGKTFNNTGEKQLRREDFKGALQPFNPKSDIAGNGQTLYDMARESSAQLDKQYYLKHAHAGESLKAAPTQNSGAYYDPSSGQKSTVSKSFHFHF